MIYRVIRGTAEFRKKTGETFELSAGDVVTAGKESISLVGVGENTQVLRLGLLKGMNELRSWTPTQRDEIDGLAGQIITHRTSVPCAPRASRSGISTVRRYSAKAIRIRRTASSCPRRWPPYSAACRTWRAVGVRMVTSSSAAVGCSAMVASKSALVAFIFTAIATACVISAAASPTM